jgi:hypothetical protein
MKVYSVYDVKMGLYDKPFYQHNKLQAIRSFADAVNDSESPFFKHPEDYRLFELGEYDQDTGLFKTDQPVLLAEALEFKKTQ